MFTHKSTTEIRFSDIDAFGHVNNAKYLTYFEQARMAYFRDIVGYDYDWSKVGTILAKTIVDFIEPIHLRDQIFIYTRCSRLGSKSFDLQYKIIKIENEKEVLVSDASTILVAFDYELNQSIEIPAAWRDLIQVYEGENLKTK